MRIGALLAVAALAAPGCRSIAHSVERMGVEERKIVGEERLSETWRGRSALAVKVEPGPDGLRLRVTAAEHGIARVRFTEEVRVTERCARRSVGGIFEAPTSGWAIADDIWVVTALAALGGSHATRGSDSRVSGVLFLVGAAQISIDALLFIPWFIGGHDWNGPCDYVGHEHPPETRTRDADVPVERAVPAAGQRLTVRRPGAATRDASCGEDGTLFVSMRELLEWSRGCTGTITVEARDGEVVGQARIEPGALLNGPDGTRVDWRSARDAAPADLAVAARLEGETLVVDIENRGVADAWQVAIEVAAADASADGRVAAVGHLAAGARTQARLALPPGVDQGAIQVSDGFGPVPGAVPFQR
jgi:hypothetical protein